MRKALAVLGALALWGCPPTGDPPAFVAGAVDMNLAPDAEPDMGEPGCVPEPESCNGEDDDCDGRIDEGEPGGGKDCDTGEDGVCAFGLTACDGGSIVCQQVQRAQLTDDCDGLDEDCDGETDEDAADQGRCDTEELGACAEGRMVCSGGEFRCVPVATPEAETCNGEDDDCDGDTDEENPEGGAACETELEGLCRPGTLTCAGGALGCVQNVQPAAEVCNGLDDDCDGETDEAFADLGDACVVGVGACERESTRICNEAGDGTTCDASAGNGEPELCNGVDDDCDEQVDEGFGLGEACESGVGACAAMGETACNEAGDGTICDAQEGEPGDEACNELDDDCDGETDEDFALGAACVDESGQCPAPGVNVCNEAGDGVACAAAPVEPTGEICNDFDDDCDGEVDETFPEKGDPCVVGEGACAADGVLACDGEGGLACDAEAGQGVAELCNGEDDDCNGLIDDRAPCLGAPAGRVLRYRIAAAGDERCAANGLAGLADALNGHLDGAVAGGELAWLARLPGYPGAVTQLDVVEADVGGNPRPGALDALGAARERIVGVQLADGALATPAAGPAVTLPSALFYDRDADYASFSRLVLEGPRVSGTAADEDGGLRLELVIQGTVDPVTTVGAYRAAAAACAERAVPGCAVFALVDADALDAALAASNAVCLVVETEPAEAGPAPGGQPCAVDEACYVGLVCRAAPVAGAMARVCGIPGGAAAAGEACEVDADCARGLCVEATAAGPLCSTLCQTDDDCAEGLRCRGVAHDFPGAAGAGGASVRACVPIAGSEDACGRDSDCGQAEVCGIWLGGEVGVADGAVEPLGLCQTPDLAGAQFGAVCAAPFDCVHGNGCASDLEGGRRCAPACDGPDQCGAGMVCLEREAGGVLHGYCLPLPDGSGGDCSGDLDCPLGERCLGAYLSSSGQVERYCGAGVGLFATGQACAEDAECASGRCVDGLCGGACLEHADCGPRLACAADADVDGDGHVLGGLCQGVDGGCNVLDRDCDVVAGCEGGRCVCVSRRCELGCDFDLAVGCPGDLYCQPDDLCAEFCHDDAGEPNDELADATPLELSRSQPTNGSRRSFCATDSADWYRFEPLGQGFDVQVLPIDDLAMDVEVRAEDGEVLPLEPFGDGVRVVVEQADAARFAEQAVYVRVVAGVTGAGADYDLTVSLRVVDCPDPGAEPRDARSDWTEILTTPGLAMNQRVDGWICPQDVDWYAVRLQGGDRLGVDLRALGNGGRGPDAIEMELYSVLLDEVVAQSAAGVRLQYTALAQNCDLAAFPGAANVGYCRFADGALTDQLCFDAEDCQGGAYLLRVAGAGLADLNQYRVDASVVRTATLPCTPDLFEFDDAFTEAGPARRLLPSGAVGVGDETLLLGQEFTAGHRLCGRDRLPADPVGIPIAEFDNLRVQLQIGEVLDVRLEFQEQPELVFVRWHRFVAGTGWTQVSEQPINAMVSNLQFVAEETGLYTVSALRGINHDDDPGYDYDGAYEVTVRRSYPPLEDQGCELPNRIELQGGAATIDGTTSGGNARNIPAACWGGDGPERVYVVRLPAGQGRLTARVEATGADDFDPAVYVRTNCNALGSEVACNADDVAADDPYRAAELTTELDGGRDVFVFVDSFGADAAGQFRLTLDWAAP